MQRFGFLRLSMRWGSQHHKAKTVSSDLCTHSTQGYEFTQSHMLSHDMCMTILCPRCSSHLECVHTIIWEWINCLQAYYQHYTPILYIVLYMYMYMYHGLLGLLKSIHPLLHSCVRPYMCTCVYTHFLPFVLAGVLCTFFTYTCISFRSCI